MLQATERQWAPGAVHDTVRTVLRDRAFYRSARNSIADRLLIWLLDVLRRMGKAMEHLPSARVIGLAVVALIVVFVLARLVVGIRKRDERLERASARRGAVTSMDPWRSADSHAAEGRYEDAAHALYRGVLLSLEQTDRIRLDPSRTSGDYARELQRRGSPALLPFRQFTRLFDVVVYGHGRATSESVAQLGLLSEPFRRRALAA